MIIMSICLKSDLDVSNVCSIISQQPFDVDALVGRYAVDAKSIMGLLALGFGKEIDIYAHTDDVKAMSALRKALQPWHVEW